MADHIFTNISNKLTEADLLKILSGFGKSISPVLTVSAAGAPDYKFENGVRTVAEASDKSIIFYDPETAYISDNMPTLIKTDDGKTGFLVKVPVYKSAQYVTLLPGESITITVADDATDAAIANKFYNDTFSALTSTAYGTKVVSNKAIEATSAEATE